MSDTRTPDEIERELDDTRQELRRTITSVQDTFSADNIFRSVSESLRANGGEWSRSINESARSNPLALAVTGVGLGWLIFGRGPGADRIGHEARSRFGQDGGRSHAYGEDADARIGRRGPAPDHDGPNWLRDEDRGPSAGQRMRAGLHGAGDTARSRMQSGSAAAGRGAERIRDRSDALAQQLRHGTEDLSEDARERIMAARERAYAASEQARRGIQRGADRAGDFFEDHPLVAGALAFAVGAAVAGAMPRSRFEDEHFGAESDALVAEAESIFAEERAKAERVAGAALDEARKVGREVGEDAGHVAGAARDEAKSQSPDARPGDAVADRVEEAAGRVADAAGKTAEKENLGHSRSS